MKTFSNSLFSLIIGVVVVSLIVMSGVAVWQKERTRLHVQIPGPTSTVQPSSLSQPVEENSLTQAHSMSDKSGPKEPMPTADIPPGYSLELIDIKFREGTEVDNPEELLPPELKNSVARVTPLFSLPTEQLDRMGSGRLKLWFRITLKLGTDTAAFIEDLKRLGSVEIVEPAPLPAPLP